MSTESTFCLSITEDLLEFIEIIEFQDSSNTLGIPLVVLNFLQGGIGPGLYLFRSIFLGF